jgi:phosphoribosylformylglycinamidine cyclo-ligase
VGYASSGLHTNGYTLARRIVFDELGLDVDDELPGLGQSVGDALLAVHRSYWTPIAPVLDRVHALAHITGGGIPGNLGRSLPSGCAARVERSRWEVPGLFALLERAGRVGTDEMYQVFNMGVGMIAVVRVEHVEAVRGTAVEAGVETWEIGEIVAGEGVQLV